MRKNQKRGCSRKPRWVPLIADNAATVETKRYKKPSHSLLFCAMSYPTNRWHISRNTCVQWQVVRLRKGWLETFLRVVFGICDPDLKIGRYWLVTQLNFYNLHHILRTTLYYCEWLCLHSAVPNEHAGAASFPGKVPRSSTRCHRSRQVPVTYK